MADTQRLQDRLYVAATQIRRGKYDAAEIDQLDELMELFLLWMYRRREERRRTPQHSEPASREASPNVVRARESQSARDQHVTTTVNHVEPQHDSTRQRISNPQVSREEHS